MLGEPQRGDLAASAMGSIADAQSPVAPFGGGLLQAQMEITRKIFPPPSGIENYDAELRDSDWYQQ